MTLADLIDKGVLRALVKSYLGSAAAVSGR